MLEQFIYINSLGETLEFGKDTLFVNENDLRDFAWDITSKNDRISGFRKGIVQKTIPVILKCESEVEGVQLRNKLFEVFERDVISKKHGKIQIGEYYLRCFITGVKKTQYLTDLSYLVLSLTVQTDLPDWVKESKIIYQVNNTVSNKPLDFPYDFPYDFTDRVTKNEINNNGLKPYDFIMTIAGYVKNPTIYIGGHLYSVNVIIEDTDYLKINSVDKTIILYKENGEQINCFNNRNRDSYIFEKIPLGKSIITSTNSEIYFEMTLLEGRSEPKWI